MEKDALIDFLHELGIDEYRVTNRSILISCPFAKQNHENGRDSRFSFSILHTGYSSFRCFTCGVRGSLSHLLCLLGEKIPGFEDERKRFKLKDLVENEALTVPKFGPKKGFSSVSYKVHPESALLPFSGGVPRYALDRGLSLETCRRWGLGHDKVNGRLVFPVRDVNGSLVGMVGRCYTGRGPKYFNYWSFQKSFFLFGQHFVINPDWPVVLVEGCFDALLVEQALCSFLREKTHVEGLGFNVMAILGSDLSDAQADYLCSLNQEVLLFFDCDAAGKKGLYGRRVGSRIDGSAILKLQKRVPVSRVVYPKTIIDAHENRAPDPGWFAENFPSALSDVVLNRKRVFWVPN